MIRALVKAKGHEDRCTDDVLLKKGFFAVIELAEAYDVIKKIGVENLNECQKEELATELIDVIFYIMDTYGILHRDCGLSNPDRTFMKKYEKNMGRSYRYGRPEKI